MATATMQLARAKRVHPTSPNSESSNSPSSNSPELCCFPLYRANPSRRSAALVLDPQHHQDRQQQTNSCVSPSLGHHPSISQHSRSTIFIYLFLSIPPLLLPDHCTLIFTMANVHNSQTSTNYKEAFSLYDKRGTGRVALDSLGDLLRACGQNPTLAEIRDLEKNVGGDCKIHLRPQPPVMAD